LYIAKPFQLSRLADKPTEKKGKNWRSREVVEVGAEYIFQGLLQGMAEMTLDEN
jgi:hypothetical protein